MTMIEKRTASSLTAKVKTQVAKAATPPTMA
jgi:hypothetical protein